MEEIKKKSGVSIITAKSSTKSFISMGGSRALSRLKVRKQSYGFSSGIAGIRTAEKLSQLAFELKRPILTFLNTYQLDPYVRFNPVQVQKAADKLLDTHFTDYKYNQQDSPVLALQLSGLLMREVKAMNFNRYRIISIVTIGQKRAQSYVNAVAFLWDHERDGFMNIQREVHTAFIQVTVFGIYLD